MSDCPLCLPSEHTVLWQDAFSRVVLLDDVDYPAYCRVEWLTHVKEMTDLKPALRDHMMKVVFAVETALREVMKPDKINLASLGNMTPHLHWHVVPRYQVDRHFPASHWAPPMREAQPEPLSGQLQSELANRIQHLASCALAD